MKFVSTLMRMTMTAAAVLVLAGSAFAQNMQMTGKFTGAKVNAGTVTYGVQGGRNVLTLSSDFQVPDTPDPHWQVVDSKGNVYLLQRLGIKGDKVNMSIALPAYVTDVAKVQIYCAWAEAVLGETSFPHTLKLTH